MKEKTYSNLEIDGGAFDLGYVAKASDLNYPSPNFKPFWEIQLCSDRHPNAGASFGGTKEECIDWMSQFYIDKFDDMRTADAQALEHAKELVRKAEALQELNLSHTDLHDLVNKLNNEQIVYLLEIIFYNRPTEVFLGSHKGVQRRVDMDEEVSVGLKGTMIQRKSESRFVEESDG